MRFLFSFQFIHSYPLLGRASLRSRRLEVVGTRKNGRARRRHSLFRPLLPRRLEHKTNKELYGNLPNITVTLMIRRLRFIGHCWRKKDEVISDLLLWEPKHGARKRGRPATTYVDQLRNDTGLSIAELKSIMENRKEWMKLVNGVRVRSK